MCQVERFYKQASRFFALYTIKERLCASALRNGVVSAPFNPLGAFVPNCIFLSDILAGPSTVRLLSLISPVLTVAGGPYNAAVVVALYTHNCTVEGRDQRLRIWYAARVIDAR